jgi:hypothetical protein
MEKITTLLNSLIKKALFRNAEFWTAREKGSSLIYIFGASVALIFGSTWASVAFYQHSFPSNASLLPALLGVLTATPITLIILFALLIPCLRSLRNRKKG